MKESATRVGIRQVVAAGAGVLVVGGLLGWRRLRGSAPAAEPSPPDRPPPAYQERLFKWTHRIHFPPIAFYSELWRPLQEHPDLPALTEKYGAEEAESALVTLLHHLLDEVVGAGAGVLYTLGKIETLLGELQIYVDEHVEPLRADEPWPEFGVGVAHPLVVEASFEFVNFLSWLRVLDERLDRRHQPGQKEPRVGLLPALADRPLRSEVEGLIKAWRAQALERRLANYVMHAGTVPQPMEGARLTPEHRVSLRVPDRPKEPVSTRWHLTYEEERDALTLAREAARAVESLVNGLLDAFEEETRAVEEERKQARAR